MSLPQVTIVGAGFCGLTSAYYLQRAGYPVRIIEAKPSVGGLLQSERLPEGLVESAANAILNSERVEEMAGTLKLEFVRTLPSARKRFIACDKNPKRWPLSPLQTLKAAWNFWRAGKSRAPRAGESIAQWGDRVLSPTVTQKLISPALQGIYASSASDLSATLILKRFFTKSSKSTKPLKLGRGSVAPKDGMNSWMQSLRTHLEKNGAIFELGQKVPAPFWQPNSSKELILLCVNLEACAELLQESHPSLARELKELPSLNVASATVFYPRANAPRERGFGVLFARESGVEALGVLENSCIFPERTKDDLWSETWIYRQPSQASEANVLSQVERDAKFFFERDAKPVKSRVTFWKAPFPVYGVELERFLAKKPFASLAANNVHVFGNYTGVLSLKGLLEESAQWPQKFGASA